jgi:hypothetical protein
MAAQMGMPTETSPAQTQPDNHNSARKPLTQTGASNFDCPKHTLYDTIVQKSTEQQDRPGVREGKSEAVATKQAK